MKLLFDNNLSPRLVNALADIFPNASHVRSAGLATADDDTVWGFAASNDYAIVTKDDDFRQMSLAKGAPPKVIHIELGNCSTDQIELLLRWRKERIAAFLQDPSAWMLGLA